MPGLHAHSAISVLTLFEAIETGGFSQAMLARTGRRSANQLQNILKVALQNHIDPRKVCLLNSNVGTSDSQSEVGEVSAKLVANFRRSLEGDFRASFPGKIVRSIFHQNSTANFTFKLHYEVLGCGGPYKRNMVQKLKKCHETFPKNVKTLRSGKTDPVLFRGVFKRTLLAFKNGRFASGFLLLGIGFL